MPIPRAVKTLVHDPQALRAARIRRGLKLIEAADRIGISFGFLGELERGTRSLTRNPALLGKLAKLYRVPIRELEAKRDAA